MIELEEGHRLRSRGPEGNDQVEIGGGWGVRWYGACGRGKEVDFDLPAVGKF